jgi:hypothetical protein
VVTSFYVFFAALTGDTMLCLAESVVTAAFVFVAVLGFRGSTWITVLALAAHGIFDVVHTWAFDTPSVHAWWGGFCWTFDLSAAAIRTLNLAWSPKASVSIASCATLATLPTGLRLMP